MNTKGDLTWDRILIFVLLALFAVFMLWWIIFGGLGEGVKSGLGSLFNLFG